jgi:hypothetical protein
LIYEELDSNKSKIIEDLKWLIDQSVKEIPGIKGAIKYEISIRN